MESAKGLNLRYRQRRALHLGAKPMKYIPLLMLLFASICAALWLGALANIAAQFITEIFFVVFVLLFTAALDPSPA